MLESAYLRLSLTDRCNLRCVYCLPEHARFSDARASAHELMRLAELVDAAVSIRKIRLTGGEPTLAEGLLDHVRHARGLAEEVCMTSNGVLLEPMLPALIEAGLSRINISLDAIDEAGFRRFSRRDGLAAVVGAIRAAKRLGLEPVKVNAVALRSADPASLVHFALWEGVHLRFIELMAIGEAKAMPHESILAHEIQQRLMEAGVSLSERQDRDEPTARIYAIDGCPVEDASVGFITTVSAPFCATCNRLRLSSQGRLFTCLMDNHGVDLLAPLRAHDEAAVVARVAAAVAAKAPPASFVRHEVMAAIGG